MLKTRHWRVFSPSAYASGPHFHLIGSSPVHKITKPQINKKTGPKKDLEEIYGGVYGVRTRDLMAASHALYQLS